jgi:hypothetical protein
MKRKIEGGWGLERKIMKIPTVSEIMREEKLTLEEAAKRCIIICGDEHKNNNLDCHRKLNGFDLCDNCPKYRPEKRKLAWLEWHPPKEYLVSKRR